MNITYDPSELGGATEGLLRIYMYNGTDWALANDTDVDEANDIVYANNVTDFGLFAIGESATRVPLHTRRKLD